MDFVRNVVVSLNLEVCHEGGLAGFSQWFDCEEDGQTFQSMKKAIQDSLQKQCTFVAAPGNCETVDPSCPSFPDLELAPCDTTTAGQTGTGTATTTTTTEAKVTTTPERPQECNGRPKDFFMAIDASKSVKDDGWVQQSRFSIDLIDALMGNGNPVGHRINAHWFNSKTVPLTTPSGIIAQGGSSPYANANDIGTFVQTENEVNQLKGDIRSLTYGDIKAGATDHPQVYHTAHAAFAQKGDPNNDQILILITDGETHDGDGCGDKLPDIQTVVYPAIGDCGGDQFHACRRDSTSGQTSCDPEKCICGLYRAHDFKNNGYTLIVVGIENSNHDTVFEKQMRSMASPGQLYFASSFADLTRIVGDIQTGVCK